MFPRSCDFQLTLDTPLQACYVRGNPAGYPVDGLWRDTLCSKGATCTRLSAVRPPLPSSRSSMLRATALPAPCCFRACEQPETRQQLLLRCGCVAAMKHSRSHGDKRHCLFFTIGSADLKQQHSNFRLFWYRLWHTRPLRDSLKR